MTWIPCKACGGGGMDGTCIRCWGTGQHVTKEEWDQYIKDNDELMKQAYPYPEPPKGHDENAKCYCCNLPLHRCTLTYEQEME